MDWKIVDLKQRDNNRFIAVCQFKVRILGTEHHIIPDIVLFLNGLPIVAIDQMLHYSEQRGVKGRDATGRCTCSTGL